MPIRSSLFIHYTVSKNSRPLLFNHLDMQKYTFVYTFCVSSVNNDHKDTETVHPLASSGRTVSVFSKTNLLRIYYRKCVEGKIKLKGMYIVENNEKVCHVTQV